MTTTHISPDLIRYMRERDEPGKSPAMRIFHLEDVVTDFCKFHKLGFIDTTAAVSAYLSRILTTQGQRT